MTHLRTTANITDPDGFYQELLQAHHNLRETDSHALDARLVLILANHIGDREVIAEAVALARTSLRSDVDRDIGASGT